MKFAIPCDQFVASLGVAARGVSTRSAIQTLSGVLVRAEGGLVELQATDMELGIRISAPGTAKFHLRTLPLEDFPKLPEPGGSTMRVPARAFVETINRVARSASRDETRPHLTGVLVSASGQELRMVATDSYRLSVKETRLEQALDGELEANIPARTLQELSRIAAGAESIGVTALENQVVFTVDDVMLSSRLVEGRFPNYQ